MKYAIINDENIVKDFEEYIVPLTEVVHEDFAHLFIPLDEGSSVKLGDIWHSDTGQWEACIIPEPTPTPVPPVQPSNAEVAQLISDLQADLIIAGVI